MRTARNIAIVALLALAVAVAPGGGAAAGALLTAITMGFLAAIGYLGHRLYMESRMTLWTLSDGRRAVLYGAFGAIVLLLAGADELLETGGGTLAWLALMGLAAFAIYRIWADATRYS